MKFWHCVGAVTLGVIAGHLGTLILIRVVVGAYLHYSPIM